MNESKLCTIAQIEQFLSASTLVEFTKFKYGDDAGRYAHISRVPMRFDYHQCTNLHISRVGLSFFNFTLSMNNFNPLCSHPINTMAYALDSKCLGVAFLSD